VVPVAASAGSGVVLSAVAAISARDVWAVGLTATAGPARDVILHWNGTSWKRAALPAHTPNGILHGVAASGAGNVWAVGSTNYATTLILHWNGTSWS
jgi:hypothetical protein